MKPRSANVAPMGTVPEPTAPRRRRGISLVELLVVMAILAAVIALIFPRFGDVGASAQRAVALQHTAALQSAINQWVAIQPSLSVAKQAWNASEDRLGLLEPFLDGALYADMEALSGGDSDVRTTPMDNLEWHVEISAWGTGTSGYPKAQLVQ